MKKTKKKLVLARETIRRLEPSGLEAIAGADFAEPGQKFSTAIECMGGTQWYKCLGSVACPTWTC